ncbi:SdpI family protein [Rhizobium sp. LCM 4573]|uniref:SdpI family protein n=1 Tax=Rhizobium sp. LCM 4573 TaxID=1848291 RepID=UPI0008DA5DA5|nr:SdpI family protein [Rhizobium sp. LCM 4573]OHV84616.1 hypothetical protein LCM4573_02840 [Rhizobium sp. LCM 4573]
MKIAVPLTLSLILLAAMAAASAIALAILPADASIGVHFDLSGNPDRFATPLLAVSIMPTAALFAILMFCLAPRFEKRRENLARSGRAYATVWAVTLVLLAAAHGFILARAFGIEVSVTHGMVGGLGLLLIATGNIAGKIRPNRTVGVRTPWTLADGDNWTKTHRLYGWFSVVCGLAVILAALFAKSTHLVGIIGIGALIATAVVPTGYSFWLSRRKAT